MGMTLEQLERAAREKAQMETYLGHQKNFSEMEVVGIIVRRKGTNGDSGKITLQYGSSGTGSIAHFGFSKALGEWMTTHLMSWIGEHVKDAREALRGLGVEV